MRGPRRGPGSTYKPRPAREALDLYGLAEVCELCRYPKENRHRLRKALPPPDAVLDMGPIWTGSTIRAWLAGNPVYKR